MCIVGGGILERYSKLRVAFLEAGAGWVAYWMKRLDEHYEYLQRTMPLIKKVERIPAQQQIYYWFGRDENTLNFVIGVRRRR